MAEDEARYDNLYMTVLQTSQGYEGFFKATFSFLRRQTDFFADQKKAESIMIASCSEQYKKYEQDQIEKKEQEEKRKQREEQRRQEKLKEAEQKQETKPEPEPVPEPKKEESDETKKEGDKDERGPAPKGNGGKTDKYIWTQLLEDVTVYIPLPPETRGNQIILDLSPERLKVQIKGQEPLIDGELHDKIFVDGSVWTLEDGEIQDYTGKYINLFLQKWRGRNTWWDSVIKGDPTINTQWISPEPQRISDLEDGPMKASVEKMMFDMKQKKAGLPNSDELQKREQLKGFMDAHPEMDFSKCNFS